MRRVLIVAGMVALGAALVVVNLRSRTPEGVAVTVEAVTARDLTAVASAAGTIQAQRQVDVSANTMGRVTRLDVVEGQAVTAGQLLLEIDPRGLEGQRAGAEAGVAAAETAVEQADVQVGQAERALEQARQALARQEQLGGGALTTTEALEQARTDVALREAELASSRQAREARDADLRQAEASLATTAYNLEQVSITAPIDGIVTRRNIEEGETVVVGTMNNAGTVLLTVADMRAIEAEVEFEETQIPVLRIGQPAAVTLDAVPGQVFQGRVSEVGSSPTRTTGTGAAAAGLQATWFRVAVAIDDEIPGVRPGFTCVVEVTTGTRKGVLAVPIQALTVQAALFDAEGELVHEEPRPGIQVVDDTPDEPPPGFTREDTRGVFVLREGRAVFTPVTLGISGERYAEVREGLEAGDEVITGPFATARRLQDGEAVYVDEP